MENQNFSSFKSLKKDSPQSQMASVYNFHNYIGWA